MYIAKGKVHSLCLELTMKNEDTRLKKKIVHSKYPTLREWNEILKPDLENLSISLKYKLSEFIYTIIYFIECI